MEVLIIFIKSFSSIKRFNFKILSQICCLGYGCGNKCVYAYVYTYIYMYKRNKFLGIFRTFNLKILMIALWASLSCKNAQPISNLNKSISQFQLTNHIQNSPTHNVFFCLLYTFVSSWIRLYAKLSYGFYFILHFWLTVLNWSLISSLSSLVNFAKSFMVAIFYVFTHALYYHRYSLHQLPAKPLERYYWPIYWLLLLRLRHSVC